MFYSGFSGLFANSGAATRRGHWECTTVVGDSKQWRTQVRHSSNVCYYLEEYMTRVYLYDHSGIKPPKTIRMVSGDLHHGMEIR